MSVVILLFVITGIYIILIGSFVTGFDNVKEFSTPSKQFDMGFSIVIPFRNECNNIPQLLDSISKLSYEKQLFECIFVDDDSTDNSVEIIQEYLSKTAVSYSVISNKRCSNSPKKDAILTAIEKAQFDWIITTDADCLLPELWLSNFSAFALEYNPKMIVGPVMYTVKNFSFLEHFQILDFLSLQGATVGSFGVNKPFLCNGANLAYEKETFIEVDGFQGNDSMASGDDIFLFEKFHKRYPDRINFLKSKSSIVYTHAVKTWKGLIQQRMRWAAKSSSYNLQFGKLVGFTVLLMNLAVIISLIMIFVSKDNSYYFLIIFLFKIGVDATLIHKTSQFYRGKNEKIKDFVFGSLLYPFFSSYIVLKTLTGKYTWKGREFRK